MDLHLESHVSIGIVRTAPFVTIEAYVGMTVTATATALEGAVLCCSGAVLPTNLLLFSS